MSKKINELKLSAKKGDAEAQCKLGIAYFEGENGRKGYREAFKWFKKSADQNNVTAQLYLGYCYQYGLGTKKNEEEAFKSFEKAAKQEDAEAQYQLGVAYAEGRGVVRDIDLSSRWFDYSGRKGFVAKLHGTVFLRSCQNSLTEEYKVLQNVYGGIDRRSYTSVDRPWIRK